MKHHSAPYTRNEMTRTTYYQLPKVFFTKHSRYQNLSLQAAVAFSFLHDRLNYSIKNNWCDENGDIYFVFTNAELCETLKVKSKATVIKIKKELEKFDLLDQKRMGLNQPNRLYLLHPNVTAEDVYEVNSDINKTSQSLEPQGSSKNEHNLYKEYLDTSKIHEDTQLDFSTSKYAPEQIAVQNADLKNHLDEIMDVKANTNFISHEALGVIKAWCNTPAQIERIIQIILNAKNSTAKEMIDQGFSLQSTMLGLEGEALQQEVTTWLRSYFNKIRASEQNPKKRIKNAENYLYRTMYNGFTKFAHTQLQAQNRALTEESERPIE